MATTGSRYRVGRMGGDLFRRAAVHMIRGFNPPRPAQSVCKLCDRLFAYFQRTKRRNFCDGCVEIERQAANVFFNELARRNRLHARTVAEEVHA